MQYARFRHAPVLLSLSLLVSLAIPAAMAQSNEGRRQPPSVADMVKRQLKLNDRDGDGKIAKDEADQRLRRVFDRADRDGDGFVDSTELTALVEQLARLRENRQRSGQAARGAKPAPTHADVAYGPHERNVLDFWQAKSDTPTPLAVFIHGGGFVGGSKEKLNGRTLRELLAAGISVAALNYRFATQAPLPAAHDDSRRAIQFLRSKAGEWNLDKRRFGAFGGSAGAQLSMYLAFHDEMADPKSNDPLDRESTRLTCVATNGGQTTMDLNWWTKHVPGYDKMHRDPLKVFGVKTMEEYQKKVADLSALSLISKDDPPIFMTYGMKPDDPVPSNPRQAGNWSIHHVIFGIKLKEKMDDLGVEADLKYPDAKTKYSSIPAFFVAKLTHPPASTPPRD